MSSELNGSAYICSVERWLVQGRRAPEAVACLDGSVVLTYGELDRRSAVLADALRAAGVGPEAAVAVLLPRSATLLVAVMAVWRAGGVYVPVDRDYPRERQARMISDSGACAVLCRSDTRSLAVAAAGRARVVDAEAGREATGAFSASVNKVQVSTSDAAYIIYTSGSTGRPKGVIIEHHSLENLVQWHQESFAVDKDSRAAFLSSPSFDASIWEIVPYMAAGAELYVAPEPSQNSISSLADWTAEKKLTHMFLPSFLTSIGSDEFADVTSLRYIFTGGERLRTRTPWSGQARLINGYGPTEATAISTACEVLVGDGTAPPIGRPVRGTQVYLISDSGLRVSPGEEGEIYIGGAGVARGYLNAELLTRESFVPDPFAEIAGARMYRTGDRAVELPDGRLDFRGRADRQVKIRGFRVELGEVEQSLERLDGVRHAAVIAEFDELNAVKRLIGFAVTAPGTGAGKLRRALSDQLPGYMIPDVIEQVSHVPVTHTGKRDEAALLGIHRARTRQTPSPAVDRARIESEVSRIWRQVLEIDEVAPGDDFFALGGDSLGMVQVSYMLELIGIYANVADIFENSEYEALIEVLLQSQAAAFGM